MKSGKLNFTEFMERMNSGKLNSIDFMERMNSEKLSFTECMERMKCGKLNVEFIFPVKFGSPCRRIHSMSSIPVQYPYKIPLFKT